jgi:hypothetical protein
MHGDIWELDGSMPSFGTVDQPFITSEVWAEMPTTNPWTLLLIILAIWLVVRNQ